MNTRVRVVILSIGLTIALLGSTKVVIGQTPEPQAQARPIPELAPEILAQVEKFIPKGRPVAELRRIVSESDSPGLFAFHRNEFKFEPLDNGLLRVTRTTLWRASNGIQAHSSVRWLTLRGLVNLASIAEIPMKPNHVTRTERTNAISGNFGSVMTPVAGSQITYEASYEIESILVTSKTPLFGGTPEISTKKQSAVQKRKTTCTVEPEADAIKLNPEFKGKYAAVVCDVGTESEMRWAYLVDSQVYIPTVERDIKNLLPALITEVEYSR